MSAPAHIIETTNPAGKTTFPASSPPPAPETEAHSDEPSKQKANNWREHAPSLWTKLLSAFTEASHDPRPDVRNSACNTLVSAIRFVLSGNAVGSTVVCGGVWCVLGVCGVAWWCVVWIGGV